jgi:aspartate kinase
MIVMKFGGSSLASAERVRGALELVRRELPRRPAVVVSASGRTTDRLIAAAEAARSGLVDTGEIGRHHLGLCAGLGLDPAVAEPLLRQLAELLRGVSLTRELTDRTRDLVLSFGERLCARIAAAALERDGIPAAALDACDIGLRTDGEHGRAAPLPGIDAGIAAALRGIAGVPVITGFLGRGPDGELTTLGRSGSDFSASIVGAAVAASEVQIWTDVCGVMTCDPGLDDRAESLRELSFEEASELAYFGAEVLHPATLVPAIRAGIPVRVLNTMQPNDPGTRITAGRAPTGRLAKSVVYKEGVALITLISPRGRSAVELLGRAVEVLLGLRVGLHMAATSEATVSLVTESGVDPGRLEAARDRLAALAAARVETGKAVICVVGEELAGRPGVLARIFGAVSALGIKARMVSQAATEINVAFLVDEAEVEPAVRALHELLLARPAG